MIHIGIIEAGRHTGDLLTTYGRFANAYANWLADHHDEFPHRVTPYDAQEGELPEAVGDCDGYIITGSAAGVYEDHDWLPPLREFVHEVVAARRRLLGVCFGHQIIADALGGRVEKSSKGWGIGHHTYEMTSAEEAVPGTFSLLACHQDQVTALPPRARHLARSDFCEFAMFAIDDHVLSLQPHPEFTPGFAVDLYERRRERFGHEHADAAIASVHEPTHAEELARWALTFFVAGTQAPDAAPEETAA